MRKLILLVVLLPFLYGLALLAASELGGEVVTLETYDARGTRFATSLWVVDLHGEPWLRAGRSDAAWLQRLRRHPEVHLTRDGVRETWVAEEEAEAGARIDAAMREKYGLADRIVAPMHDEDRVAVRLSEP